MAKLTRWQRELKKSGYLIIDFTHEEIMDHLLQVFERDRADLTAKAAADITGRHKLSFILDYENLGDQSTTFGGMVHYNKKLRRFTYISYSDDHNWAVLFSIESRVAHFSYDYWKNPLFKPYRRYGLSIKRLTQFLRDH